MSAFRVAGPRASAALLLFVLLLFIYPVKGTIALRNLLVLAIFACSWIGLRAWCLTGLKPVGAMMVLLTLWLAGQALYVSAYPEIAVANLSGDWLRGILAALLACQLHARLSQALGSESRATKWLLTATVAAFFCHSLRVFVEQIMLLVKQGGFNFGFPARDVWSDVNNAALALLLADQVSRHLKNKDFLLALPRFLSLGLLMICLVDLYLLRTSNGTFAALVILVISCLFLARHLQRRGILVVCAGVLVAVTAIASDSRSYRFIDTLPLAWDIDRYEVAWLHDDRTCWPHTPDGKIVEESTFLRVSWAHAALREVIAHPLGFGYSHRAYGYAINQRYGTDYDIQSSHNGWLDFALAGGIPALLLWVGAEVWLMMYGLRCFRRGNNPAALALLLVVADYTVRCAIDGHLSGARLEWFWLLAGLLAVMTARADQEQDKVEATAR